MDGNRFGPDAAEEIGLDAQPPLGKADGRIQDREGEEDGIEPADLGETLRNELEEEDARQDEHAGLQPLGPQETPGLDAEDMRPAPRPEGPPRLRGNLLLQRIIALVLEQHHQEAAEHGEQIKYQQRDKSPSERHEQKAGRSQNERHRQVGRLPELGNRQKAIPAALRDGPGPDERVHHRLVVLENELEKEVGNDEAQADTRHQQRREIGNPLLPQHEEQQQLQKPEIDNDDNLTH